MVLLSLAGVKDWATFLGVAFWVVPECRLPLPLVLLAETEAFTPLAVGLFCFFAGSLAKGCGFELAGALGFDFTFSTVEVLSKVDLEDAVGLVFAADETGADFLATDFLTADFLTDALLGDNLVVVEDFPWREVDFVFFVVAMTNQVAQEAGILAFYWHAVKQKNYVFQCQIHSIQSRGKKASFMTLDVSGNGLANEMI